MSLTAVKLPVAFIEVLPVDLAEHDVERADHSDDVGQHVAFHDLVHRRQVREARRANLQALTWPDRLAPVTALLESSLSHATNRSTPSANEVAGR